MCSITMLCSSDTNSSVSSVADIGRIVGIVIGSILCFAFLICIIVIIYLVCCKRKPQVQVWTQPSPRFQGYRQAMPTFSYTNYPLGHMYPQQTDPQRMVEEPPPSYEEVVTIEDPNEKV